MVSEVSISGVQYFVPRSEGPTLAMPAPLFAVSTSPSRFAQTSRERPPAVSVRAARLSNENANVAIMILILMEIHVCIIIIIIIIVHK